jgi:phosphodiesterase/alkaline phosphatase D-like protein
MAAIEKERVPLKIAAIVVGVAMLLVTAGVAVGGESSASSQFDPTIESVFDTLAFIRWVTPNPGGTILHYAVVHYGTDPKHLDRTAKSPTRINSAQSEMIFRVRVGDLQPGTTYYYRVFSEQATGISDPATSGVQQFTTRRANTVASK